MNKIEADLIGMVHLYENVNRTKPLQTGWWGIANLLGEKIMYSYVIHLYGRAELEFGQSCQAGFRYKFSDDEKFKKTITIGQIIELREGKQKIGEFRVESIENDKLETVRKQK